MEFGESVNDYYCGCKIYNKRINHKKKEINNKNLNRFFPKKKRTRLEFSKNPEFLGKAGPIFIME